MTLFTIGFTQRSAEDFFTCLKRAGVRRIVDVRLNNTSQLAGFAKVRDLPFLLRAVINADYVHLPVFAPTQEILDHYKKEKGAWERYEQKYAELAQARDMANIARQTFLDKDCLLCSEHSPDQCHRRLLAEHVREQWPDLKVAHL